MRKVYSLIACCIICVLLIQARLSYFDFGSKNFKVTTWDALGYYMYLPAIFIYGDVTELKWLDEVDRKYGVTGGTVYQVRKCDNGNFVFKYLAGVAIIEAPFFFIGHWLAQTFNYEADGFSPPYQYAISVGILFWFMLSIFLLRKIMLRFFSDPATAITLLLVTLATNIIQYAAIDNAQSHGPIFPLYVLVLYTTLKWHEKPSALFASLTGFIIGLATICRPTEAIMFLIPLLWNTHTKEIAKEKWSLVKQKRKHVLYFLLFGFIGVLPQLIYWKVVTDSFIYDVGSKWNFLNPFFRVLFGWEKGWFIYTPVTILFIAGFFFMKNYPFKKSVIYFCLLNIYIIISWHDWRYGGSYSTRALSHSYPVFALALAALIERINLKKWRTVFYVLGIYLIAVNLFQINQYNKTILHYDDMNRNYYGRIYLNPHPSPLDMSLLDNEEFLRDESDYEKEILREIDTSLFIKVVRGESKLIFSMELNEGKHNNPATEEWLKIEAEIKISKGFSGSYLRSELVTGDSVKQNRVRLFSPISKEGEKNIYAFYVSVPQDYKSFGAVYQKGTLKLIVQSENDDFEGRVERIKVIRLRK